MRDDKQRHHPHAALPDVKNGPAAYGITWTEIDDAEGDDVIAAIAAASPSRDVLIMSVDQDYCQLLRDPAPGRGAVGVMNTTMRPGRRRMTSLAAPPPRAAASAPKHRPAPPPRPDAGGLPADLPSMTTVRRGEQHDP